MLGGLIASCGATSASPTVDATRSVVTQPTFVAQVDAIRAAAVGIDATGCVERSHGSGFRVTGDLVVTAAHVVAGADTITLTAADGTTSSATLIALDPIADTAVLRADHPTTTHFELAVASPDDPALVVVSRHGTIEILPATIIRHVIIRTEDIYHDSDVDRSGYELDAMIERGDSGGAVVVDGRLVGLVWSRSRLSDSRGWAVDAMPLESIIADPSTAVVPADARCT
jgi:S1-C subfamily serine protease